MLARGFVPRPELGKQTALLLLIVPLFAASCGSSATPVASGRVVSGPGFRFSAPAGWQVAHTPTSAVARSRDAVPALVSAGVYRLGRPYSPSGFDRAAKELDGVAARLARAAGGVVTSSATTTVGGLRIRAYSFTSRLADGRRYDDRVGFVLAGRREVQLLCQAPAGAHDPDGACALLFASFALRS